MKAVAIVSGGMDSVTLAYYFKSMGIDLKLVSFDYGQKHKKELSYAELCARNLAVEYIIIDLQPIGAQLDSALTSPQLVVPDGHYTNDNMEVTVVPNRNAIMLSIATGIAVSQKVDFVGIGVHGGDHYIYPDCRSAFIVAFEKMAQLATDSSIKLIAPFLHVTKAEIVSIGTNLGVDYEQTWSCYKGEQYHCGTCGTCIERKEAFEIAGVIDPTKYGEM